MAETQERMTAVEQMFMHYETVADMNEYYEREDQKLINKTVRITSDTVRMLDVLVEEISKYEDGVTRTSLMSQFVSECSITLLGRMGLWTEENQRTIFDIKGVKK